MEEKNVTASLKTYNDTWNKRLKPYVCIDNKGQRIQMNPKNPLKHESDHPVEHMPTYFYNLDHVVKNPDKTTVRSNTDKAIENEKTGKTVVYIKENFVESLSIPGQEPKNEQTLVVVFYGDDGKNFTRTYRTEVKTT